MNKSNLESFYAIADIAATSWYRSKCYYFASKTWTYAEINRKTDDKAFTFRCPNFKHPSGYFAALISIAKNENGLTRRELCELLKVKSIVFTVYTLIYADLIKLNTYTHKFTITPFGRAYLALAERARPELEILAAAKALKKLA